MAKVIEAPEPEKVWVLPRISEALKEPVGTPAELTPTEAKALALAAFGIDKDLPPGTKYTRRVRKMWIRREDGPTG